MGVPRKLFAPQGSLGPSPYFVHHYSDGNNVDLGLGFVAPSPYFAHHYSDDNNVDLDLGFAALGVGMLVLLAFFTYYSRMRSSRTSPCDLTPWRLQRFSYRELKAATNDFDDSAKLGKGGFGVVYKGVLKNGKEVAVKRLDVSSVQGEREFQNEMSIIAGLRSPFIVSLLGYCSDGRRKRSRFLVYEHMQNRSLQEALFENDDMISKLDWEKRFGIVVDVAQALAFLHLQCDPSIIHGDVKPSNVLLDCNFKARIADFGLARLKCDDHMPYFVDMFSQDLGGRSQELWKSQEIGKRNSKSEDTSDDESKMKTKTIEEESIDLEMDDHEPTRDSSVGDFELHAKGKEIVSEHVGGPEDWGKRFSSEGVDWSKEFQVDNREIPKRRLSWCWKNDDDGSGELSTKNYVMEWIGSQIRPSRIKKSKRKRKRNRDEETVSNTDSVKGKKVKEKTRKIKEWWKEEYFAEMSKKSRKLEKFTWKRSFHVSKKSSANRTDSRGIDFVLDKIRRDCSMGSEMWSGDLMSRELSSTTSMRGTVCYIPPEYGGCGVLSEKGDIYSFGVLILVIVSGRRPLHVLASPMKDFEKANLISWARHLAQTGKILELVSDSLKGIYDTDQASLCITLALLCLQRIPEMRPDISEIVKILKGEMDVPPFPIEFSPSPPSRLYRNSKKKVKSDAAASLPEAP